MLRLDRSIPGPAVLTSSSLAASPAKRTTETHRSFCRGCWRTVDAATELDDLAAGQHVYLACEAVAVEKFSEAFCDHALDIALSKVTLLHHRHNLVTLDCIEPAKAHGAKLLLRELYDCSRVSAVDVVTD